MKNKPHRHKETNTFKFQPFSDRINNIKIDVYHNVKHKYEEESEEVTYLYQTLEKWTFLNCSESFQELKSEIPNNIQILPQVIVLKDQLVDILKKHLSNKNPYNLQAVLELIVALAKDLRQEFYPYFSSIFELLVPLLNIIDADIIENTFQCLAYLFKFLWRHLSKNLPTVFDSLLPLLSSAKPSYINNFAAQSFAFVARKVKDHQYLIKIILKSLKKCPDGIDGCGRLMFEVIRGVSGQFHSCAEATLNSLFLAINDPTLPHDLVWELIQKVIVNIVTFIHIQHISLLWNIYFQHLNTSFSSWFKEKTDRNTKNVKEILKTLYLIVKAKDCKYVTDTEKILTNLTSYLEGIEDLEIVHKISDIFSLIILSHTLNLSNDLSRKYVKTAITYFDKETLVTFITKIIEYKNFDITLLPLILDFCKTVKPNDILVLLANIILHKSTLPKNEIDFFRWSPYKLNFIDNTCFTDTYISIINDFNENSFENYDNIFRILIILPNLQPINKKEAINTLVKLFKFLCTFIHETDNSKENLFIKKKALFLLCQTVETLICLKSDENITKLLSTELFITTVLPYANSQHIYVLRILDYFITVGEIAYSEMVTLKKQVISNLTSPYHKVRKHSIHILLEIEKCNADRETTMIELLDICCKAELIPTSLNDYREKLKFLQKIDATNESVQAAIVGNRIDYQIFLRYLIGVLYVNFKLMWNPVSKLIASYANVLEANQFWTVFGLELKNVGDVIREQIEEPKLVSPFKDKELEDWFMNLNNLDDRPDHINHRIILWETLSECVNVCESKSRDIVIEFFKFLENEYFKRHSDHAKCWDISNRNQVKDMNSSEILKETIDEETVELEDDTVNELTESFAHNSEISYKDLTKSLLVQMKVLGKNRSPKNVFRERELYKIYIDFLSHKLADIQKAALDCILMYKHKFLVPYREHLYGLIDDTTFKKEATVFRIDKETDIIRPEHRNDLIPFVLRIVYSKLYTKSSTMKGQTKQERKATVIRFLAGCSSQELTSFFQMAFSVFNEIVEKHDNIFELAERIKAELNIEKVIPPKRIQSHIYLLNTILIHCGGLLENIQQSYLLKILVSISGHVAGIFSQRNHVHPSYIKQLRDIRNACFECLIKFYDKFENYQWSKDETDAVFEVLIWPYLKKLPIEGIYSPTALLKLFMVWSRNPRYFVLLGKYHKDESNFAALPYIIQLWLSQRIHASVSNTIMELIENLLTLQHDDSDSLENKRLEVTNAPTICKDKLIGLKQPINYGSILLIPFIPDILTILQRKLSTKHGLNKKDMEVMSRMTELVSEPDSCDQLLTLLLPLLMKKSNCNEDIIIPLLNTTYNLIKHVQSPGRYVRKLAPLYGAVESPAARKLLFSIVIDLSKEIGSECGLDENLLADLNAWDVKWIDQPDFNRRLNAFKKIEEMTKDNSISVNLGVIIIYTCYHFIKTEKDLSLRENSRFCLQQVCPTVCQSLKDNNKEMNFVIGTILQLIKRGVADKENENLRSDSISLLGIMARECSPLHPVFNDLSLLTNKTDLEVDFFENINHLQLHRRVRAFLKFTTVAETLEKPFNVRTLMDFILPLINYYLLSEKFSSKNSLIDSVVKALGTVCRMLPWRLYQTLLLSYLQKLQDNVEFQKQLVKVVVEILNAFHFDLSLADDNVLSKQFNNIGEDNLLKNESEEKENNEANVNETDNDVICLDNEEENEVNMQIETIADDKTNVKLLEKETQLSKENATNVIRLIAGTLLPQMHKTLAQRTQSDLQHKLIRKTTGPDRDEEDVLRVPLAVALVKLLQKLPSKKMLDTHLPGIFMRLCTFLKSRLDSVRRVTRETLQTIMISLGTSYLPLLIHEMSTLLTKGFHVHVLVYSLHSVLKALTPYFVKGDLDRCVNSLLRVCRLDLFGHAAEEKEVNQILGKVMEARANRSYDIFHILATYISENYLINIIIPLKEELSRTLSHKSVSKVRECLQQIVLGLTVNTYISAESLLQFAYGTATESIPALKSAMKKEPMDPKQAEYESRKQPDSFIIADEPKKRKALETITCSQTNANLLVEFGLRLFYFLFKREKLKDQNYAAHLDPVVLLLSDCIKSQHVKVSILAIQCLCWVLKMDLPSVHAKIRDLSVDLFSILHKYASAGLSNKGDNYELVMITFKAVAVIVRDVKHYELDAEQIRALLLYCEQDLDDYTRQVTAFSLLKAVIKKKLNAPELYEVVRKVGKLSITSGKDSIRLQARQVMLHYLLDYPLGKRIENLLSFYFSQLNYDHQYGRSSALEMIKLVTNAFPIKALQENCAVIFVNVSTSLVNDPQPDCRQQAAEIIGLLLSRIDNNCKDKLFDVTKLWLQDSKVSHRRLAAQILGLFVAAEKEKFEARIAEVLPLLVKQFVEDFQKPIPGRFVLINPPQPNNKKKKNNNNNSDNEHLSDHHLYQVLNMLVKLGSICSSYLNNPDYIDYIETIADHAQGLLGHAHEWVRHAAVQLLGQIVCSTPASVFAEIINDPSKERSGYLMSDTANKIRSLTLDLTAQLIAGEDVNEKFLIQCMKLLVYIAEILKHVKVDSVSSDERNQPTLIWLVKQIRKKMNLEIIHAPKSTIVRKMCFNWIAAMAVKLNRDELEPLANLLLFPLIREMNYADDGNSLRKLANETASYIKSKLGIDLYRALVVDITRRLEIKKADRKKERSLLMVTDPERAAKRKINKQLKKKEMKKRKIHLIKNHKYKKKKKNDVEIEE